MKVADDYSVTDELTRSDVVVWCLRYGMAPDRRRSRSPMPDRDYIDATTADAYTA